MRRVVCVLMLTEQIPSVRSNHSQLPDSVANQETANVLQTFFLIEWAETYILINCMGLLRKSFEVVT